VPTAPLPDLVENADALLTPAEVARLFRVDPKTVARWEKDGRLASVKTLGGHRRYPRSQITRVLNAGTGSTEVVRALEEVHALALDVGAMGDAGHVATLIETLRAGKSAPQP
jgi:excisionase family DNA binding protein